MRWQRLESDQTELLDVFWHHGFDGFNEYCNRPRLISHSRPIDFVSDFRNVAGHSGAI